MSKPNPSAGPRDGARLRALPKQSGAGIIATALLALVGLFSGGLWSMLLMIALVVLVTAAYGWIFRRTTWLRLPRKRSAAAIGFAVAFAVLLGSTSAYGASHPADAVKRPAPAAVSAAPSTPASKPHSTPKRTPTPTPVVTTELVTSTAPIPFDATTTTDPKLAKGTSAVTTAGVDGVMTTTFRVTLTDGAETGREQISQEVTTPPVTQVTAVGSYVRPAAPAAPAVPAAPAAPAAPVAPGNGATALCHDGTYSYAAHHQGACSWHGGVAQFYK